MRPALNLRGISGGDVGARATNSIPTEASASIDFRLVPDQTPEKVRARLEDHLRKQGYTIVGGRAGSEGPVARRRVSSGCAGARVIRPRAPRWTCLSPARSPA